MLHSIWVLVRARILIVRNGFWHRPISHKIGVGVIALVGVGIGGALYWASNTVIGTLVRIAHTYPDLAASIHESLRQSSDANFEVPTNFNLMTGLEVLPNGVFFVVILFLLFTCFASLLSALYLSGDLEMLLVAPVPMRSVFAVKFFSGLFSTYLLLFWLLGPTAVGYGRAMNYGMVYFLVVPVVLVLLPLLPASFGVILIMAVVRVMPPQRAREIVAAIGGFIGIGFYLVSQLLPHFEKEMTRIYLLFSLRYFDFPLLPSTWAGRMLTAAGKGDWPALLVYGGVFTIFSVGGFVGCLLLTEKLYYEGWSNMAVRGGTIGKKTKIQMAEPQPRPVLQQWVASIWKIFPATSRAIFFKDIRLVMRDLRNLQQLIFPLVMAAIFAFQLVSGKLPSSPGSQGFLRTVNMIGATGITFFICISLSGALGGPAISREGKEFWLLKTAPLSSWQLIFGKYLLAYVPFPVVGTLFLALLTVLQGNTWTGFMRSLALVLILGLGSTSISVGLGAAYAKLDWENPQQQTTFRAGCLTPIFHAFYIGFGVATVVALPELSDSLLSGIWPTAALALKITGWLVFIGLTAGVIWGMLSYGVERVDKLEIS